MTAPLEVTESSAPTEHPNQVDGNLRLSAVKRLWPRTLGTRLTGMLLAMLLSMNTVFGLTAYWVTESFLEDLALSGLEALATTKQAALRARLTNYLETQHGVFRPMFAADVLRLLTADVDAARSQQDALQSYMKQEIDAEPDLERIEVADAEGIVFISSESAREGTTVTETVGFREGLIQSNVSDVVSEEGHIRVIVSAPICNADGDTVAVAEFRFNARELLAMTGDYTGLGRTGETVLGARRGDAIHFLAPLRFDPNLSDITPAQVTGERAKPMIHATSGQTGTTYAPDYRDVQVVAAYRPLKLTGWGVVVKQDRDEIFSGARQLRRFLVIAFVVMVALGVAFILPAVNRFTRPVHNLVDAADNIAEGRMDVEMVKGGTDEIGRLASSFNHMVARLREARAELSAANEELRERARDLTDANEELEAFIYSISHDLKTPVVSVLGLADLLKKELGPELSDQSKTYLAHIDNSTERMGQLIDDLLEMSRVGRMDTTPAHVQTARIAQEVVSEIQASVDDRQVEFVISPDLPDVWCNGKRLYQILSNLVGNAVKFTAGMEQAHIEIGWERPQDTPDNELSVFFVRDNGPGIPGKDQERIFDLFGRLHGHNVPGTGLGLALVKRILETMGGSIDVESIPGQGATFLFSIPAKGK